MPDASKRPTRQRSSVAIAFTGIFAASVVASLYLNAPVPAIVASPCLAVAVLIDRRIEKRFASQSARFRDQNAGKFPDVFSVEPPNNLDNVTSNMLDIYDRLTFSFLGSVTKSDIAAILRIYGDTPELLPNGTNDIPYTSADLECYDDIGDEQLSEEFLRSVRPIFEADPKIDLVIRWVPAQTAV